MAISLNFTPPYNSDDFFAWLKQESEKLWLNQRLNPTMYEFQGQHGIRWLEGLAQQEIRCYENEMGFTFPQVYKTFLQHMNGLELPVVNVHGQDAYRQIVGYYSYPRDLQIVKEQINWILEEFKITPQNLEAKMIPHILPIVGHRFLVMDRCETNPVLSMHGTDVVAYSPSLPEFLVRDIFGNPFDVPHKSVDVRVSFWLD